MLKFIFYFILFKFFYIYMLGLYVVGVKLVYFWG